MTKAIAVSIGVLCLALAPTASAAAPASGEPAVSAARACPSFSFKHNGVPWRAERIRVRNIRCRGARELIRSYAKPRNCQFEERCKVGRWVCRTVEAEGSRFIERCSRGPRVVRWHGSYVSR